MNRVTKFFTRTFAGGRNVMLATGAGSTPPAPNMHWIFSTAISTAEIRQIQPDLERPMSRPPRLAFMGRLAPEKGLPYLIQALAHLRAGGLNPLPVVELVGDGPLRRKLEEQVNQLGLQSNVHFIGALSRHEMLERLCGMDLAVLPSLTESFMKARLDAMLCGLPVITTGVGFGRELVGSDGCRGWIVPVGDSRALADTLATAINGQQDWAGLRKRSREFAETYTVEAWAQHIAEICERQWHLPLDGGKLSE
jgi:glycosyltransferase involved in cell wall biosynthesis